jgi:glycosyltransferase involved in cell wall biosynthesis
MRILHFTNSLQAGGKERQLVELLKGLSLHKDIVCQLAVMSSDVHYPVINKLNIEIHYLIRKSKKDPKILLKLYDLCKAAKPDIIHAWDSMTSIYALPIAKKFGIKLITGMIRNAPAKLKLFGKNWFRSKLTFPFSDIIVSNSHAGIKSYRAPYSKSVCIHNGFDFERVEHLKNKENVKKNYKIRNDKVVGMVASFSNNKDYDTFITAAQSILQAREDVTFLAIGDGVNLEKCRKLVKPQFRNKIKFLGKQKDIEPIVNTFDIGVLASYTEGISNSIMEYMALGKPVVATNGGGTNELVLHGKTGFLVDSYSAHEMSRRIEQLLDDEELADRMGTAGRERIKREFSLEKMTNLYVELYERLLNV